MRAALVIGHGPRADCGAEGRTRDGAHWSELSYNRELVPLIAAGLETRGHEAEIIHRVRERMQPIRETNWSGADCAVEFHLNAAGPRATGTEMIRCPGSKEGVRLGRLLQDAACMVLGLPDRGVKTPWRGRGKGWLLGTTMPAVIAESFFVTNSADLERGVARMRLLAIGYALALSDYLDSLGEKSTNKRGTRRHEEPA